DPGMDRNLARVQCALQFLVAGAEVVDPDRRIGEDQCFPGRRRRMFFNPGMEPPKAAKRRALSRSMRALRASRINAVFSSTPVNSWAVRMRSSSRAMVVRIRDTDASNIASNDVEIDFLSFSGGPASRNGPLVAFSGCIINPWGSAASPQRSFLIRIRS